MQIPWILIALVLLLALCIVAVVVTRKYKRPPDYYALFIMGLIWLPLGIPLDNYFFSVMGLVLMIIGLANKDKWKKNRVDWSKMKKGERNLMLGVIILMLLLLVLGVAVFFLINKGVLLV